MADLPPVQFVDDDPLRMLQEMVAEYETLTGRTLYPADPERMLLQTIAYALGRQRGLVNHAGRSNLLSYASGAHLDALAELVGVQRKTPVAASTVLRFFRALGYPGAVAIPQGSRAAAGSRVFETTAASKIADLESFTDVPALAVATGSASNSFVAGQVKAIVDPIAGVARVENVTTTAGGADTETDEELRARIGEALAATSAAGSAAAYRALALASHPDVHEASVYSPYPGLVRVVVLGRDGALLGAPVRTAIQAALSADTVRPVCDVVQVVGPTVVSTPIDLTWYGLRSRNSEMDRVQGEVLEAVAGYQGWQTGGLGRDVVPARLTAAVMAIDGVKRVHVALPAFSAVGPAGVVRVTGLAVRFGGVEDV